MKKKSLELSFENYSKFYGVRWRIRKPDYVGRYVFDIDTALNICVVKTCNIEHHFETTQNGCFTHIFAKLARGTGVLKSEYNFRLFLENWDDIYQEALSQYIEKYHNDWREYNEVRYDTYFMRHMAELIKTLYVRTLTLDHYQRQNVIKGLIVNTTVLECELPKNYLNNLKIDAPFEYLEDFHPLFVYRNSFPLLLTKL